MPFCLEGINDMAKKSNRKKKKLHELRTRAKKRREKAELKRLNIPIRGPEGMTSQNHFVPQWYQRNFLPPDKYHFYYMDLLPEVGIKPNGETYNKKECLRLGPKRCFKQEHLYTLELFNYKSDIIERQLFGDIDTYGSNSFDIFLGQDAWQQKKAHDKFESFIEFMDAQKLRTPKGMNFIKSLCIAQGQKPNKILVLGLLQQYRRMHCAMWIESIWEVVNAKNSGIKFIINDHPVISYNSKMTPSTNVYGLSIDPPISLLGTHTIYPLDLNHCLILTHRQYALAHDKCNPLKDRINARYGDKAIFGFQDIIYTRSLSEEEVNKINYITKKSALRYVASSEKTWLNPEQCIKENWENIGEILLPPKDKITLTQSIVIGHRDGSTEAYDPFGRDISKQEHKDFQKIVHKIKLGEDLSKILNNDSKTDLNKKSLVLLDSIKEIFGISKNKSIEDVKKELNEGHVLKLYHIVAELYPHSMNFCDLIPTDNKFRGLFLGNIHPLTIIHDTCNLIHLFDEIFIINPFFNPYSMRDNYSPLRNPKQFLKDTYRLILSILMIEPFIVNNLIKIIPAPDEFDYPLKMKLIRAAEKRAKKINIKKADYGVLNRIVDIEMEQLTKSLPKDYLRTQIKKSPLDISDEEVEKVLEYFNKQTKCDITDFGRSLEETGPQLQCSRLGLNLESTLLFCKLTGAVPVTNIPFKHKEFVSVVNISSGCKPWNPLINLFNRTDFYFDFAGDLIFNHFLRSSGFFMDFREYLKKIYTSVLHSSPKTRKNNLKTLCQEYPQKSEKYNKEWQDAISIYEEWINQLPEETRNNIPLSSREIFTKGKIRLVLGNLNLPLIDHLLNIHFPREKVFNIIPMAIFWDCMDRKE